MLLRKNYIINNNDNFKSKNDFKRFDNIINEMFNFKKKFKFLGLNKSHYKFTPYSVDDDTDIIKINLGHFRGLEEG